MPYCLASVALACFAGSVSMARQATTDVPPATEVIAKARSELRRLQTGRASDFFVALCEPDRLPNKDRLSQEQTLLIGRLNDISRNALRLWLTRLLLEKETSALTPDQVERNRVRVVAHAEAIVCEAILTPAQLKRLRPVVTRPAMPPVAGRYGIFPTTISDDPPADTLWRARNLIHCEAKYLGRSGGSGCIGAPRGSSLGRKDAVPGITVEQSDLTRRIEILARDVQRAWLLLAISNARPSEEVANDPPTQAMIDRLSDRGRWLRASVVAHAEAILVDAVLKPEQGDASKRLMWKRTGAFALLDPELAAKIRLTRTQREEIANLIAAFGLTFSTKRTSFGRRECSNHSKLRRAGRSLKPLAGYRKRIHASGLNEACPSMTKPCLTCLHGHSSEP